MTEKRFTLTNDYFWENQKPISSEDVCELLNKLHEENEQLKKELKSFRPLYFKSENGVTTLYEKVNEDD